MIPIISIILFVIFVCVAAYFKSSTTCSNYPPGPLRLPIFGSIFALGSKPHETLSQLKEKYGNVISIDFGSHRAVILNDMDTIKQGLGSPHVQKRPETEATLIIRGGKLCGMMLNSGKPAEEQRAFVMRALKRFGMGKKTLEILMTEELQRLCATFDKQLGIPIVNNGLFQLTTVTTLWSILTGEHGKTVDVDLMDLLQKILKAGRGLNVFTLFFPTLCKLFPNLSGWKDFTICGNEIHDYTIKSIQLHKKNFNPEEKPQDLIAAFVKKIESCRDQNSSFFGITGYENLKGVLADLLGAGTDTTAATITWFVTLAVYYPEIQEKMQYEIDRVIGKVEMPSLDDRSKLPYVESVILEVLRFSALVPLGFPHETSADVKIENYIIPKGTVVMTNVYDALHDPKQWNEPENFNPERFLNKDKSAIERNIARNVDLVFGHGKRSCPGEPLAKDQLFLLVTRLSQMYTFQKDPRCRYGGKIETILAATLFPRPHSFIINKR